MIKFSRGKSLLDNSNTNETCTVSENVIDALKMRNNYGDIYNFFNIAIAFLDFVYCFLYNYHS